MQSPCECSETGIHPLLERGCLRCFKAWAYLELDSFLITKLLLYKEKFLESLFNRIKTKKIFHRSKNDILHQLYINLGFPHQKTLLSPPSPAPHPKQTWNACLAGLLWVSHPVFKDGLGAVFTCSELCVSAKMCLESEPLLYSS